MFENFMYLAKYPKTDECENYVLAFTARIINAIKIHLNFGWFEYPFVNTRYLNVKEKKKIKNRTLMLYPLFS